ncbi:uncharacterized protein LOC129016056 [Pongo pygmaeus]|uniref:uncharacterized protein LOC129016056 n=1 Tax=Pongo pygmaeus TaxID=9600 RepID=UPI00300C6D84
MSFREDFPRRGPGLTRVAQQDTAGGKESQPEPRAVPRSLARGASDDRRGPWSSGRGDSFPASWVPLLPVPRRGVELAGKCPQVETGPQRGSGCPENSQLVDSGKGRTRTKGRTTSSWLARNCIQGPAGYHTGSHPKLRCDPAQYHKAERKGCVRAERQYIGSGRTGDFFRVWLLQHTGLRQHPAPAAWTARVTAGAHSLQSFSSAASSVNRKQRHLAAFSTTLFRQEAHLTPRLRLPEKRVMRKAGLSSQDTGEKPQATAP